MRYSLTNLANRFDETGPSVSLEEISATLEMVGRPIARGLISATFLNLIRPPVSEVTTGTASRSIATPPARRSGKSG